MKINSSETISSNLGYLGLKAVLKSWQLSGQEKLVAMAESPFRGGFLADQVGLGKSLTALVAALRIKKEKKLAGFILVTCPKQCTVQWYAEVQAHFAKVSFSSIPLIYLVRC